MLEVNDIFDGVVSLRRKLHITPELAGKEFETQKAIRDYISDLPLNVLPPFLETDTVAFLEGGKGPGPNEQTPRLPATSPYGNTKQMCEDILRDVVAATAGNAGACGQGVVKGIALRYFNPIGAHPSALIGELPRGVPNNLVPFITQTAIGKRECLSIFGNDYPTEDGTCLRDYIDIVDLAKAHVAAVTRMVEGKMKQGYEIFNVGTGRPVSVYELVTAFEKVNGLKLNYKFVDRRPGDVMAIWADTQLANEELGWKAERSVEDTLASAWAWEKHLAGK